MKALIKELKELQLKELDRLVFLVEQEIFGHFTEKLDIRLDALRKMKKDIENG